MTTYHHHHVALLVTAPTIGKTPEQETMRMYEMESQNVSLGF
jgi:hypothetical protein